MRRIFKTQADLSHRLPIHRAATREEKNKFNIYAIFPKITEFPTYHNA